MTLQEMFDTVKNHLIKQGKRSMGSNRFRCAYRGVDNTKCAIGCLIPDALYDMAMEGASVVGLVAYCPSLKYAFTASNSDYRQTAIMLTRLQNVHDLHDPHDWAAELNATAAEFHLECNLPVANV